MAEENEKRVDLLNELQLIKDRFNEAGIHSIQKLTSLMKSYKEANMEAFDGEDAKDYGGRWQALERQEYHAQSEYKKEPSLFLSAIAELEEKLSNGTDDKDLCDRIDNLFSDASEKLEVAKRELASKMTESVSLKRELEDHPIQEEVVQYEQRFSELDVHIEDILHRTRKYYATYNALLMIKDLMVKEISLLNSLDSQFRDVIKNPAGHMKLIHSMEAILKGAQQKLEKVEPGLQVGRKASDALTKQCGAAIANQRRCSVLLKAFQEECRKNERLKQECAMSERLRGETSESFSNK